MHACGSIVNNLGIYIVEYFRGIYAVEQKRREENGE